MVYIRLYTYFACVLVDLKSETSCLVSRGYFTGERLDDSSGQPLAKAVNPNLEGARIRAELLQDGLEGLL